MKYLLFMLSIAAIVSPAYSFHLDNHAANKTNIPVVTNVSMNPRQGGDTIQNAFQIGGIPFDSTGTTSGFTDDYDYPCALPSSAPDVVYSYLAEADLQLTVDLFGSEYDTKVYIFNESMEIIACNDDYYENYVSKIIGASLLGGITYYIIIDGYGFQHGQYVLHLEEYHPCEIFCPDGADQEGEPPLVDGYVDALNGGCNSVEMLGYAPFQTIEGSVFCGTSGWYLNNNSAFRDTDWYTMTIPETGYIEISAIAELSTTMYELVIPDCESVSIIQEIILPPCEEQTMTITGEAGTQTWLWVGSSTIASPSYFNGSEYNYTLFTNFQTPVSIEHMNWDKIKALYR